MASKLVFRRQRLFQSLFISALYLTPVAWAIDPCAAIISLQTLDRRGHESSVGELQHSAAMEIPLRNSPDGDAIAVMEEFVRKLFPPPAPGKWRAIWNGVRGHTRTWVEPKIKSTLMAIAVGDLLLSESTAENSWLTRFAQETGFLFHDFEGKKIWEKTQADPVPLSPSDRVETWIAKNIKDPQLRAELLKKLKLRRAFGFAPWKESGILMTAFRFETEVGLTVNLVAEIHYEFALSSKGALQRLTCQFATPEKFTPRLWVSSTNRGKGHRFNARELEDYVAKVVELLLTSQNKILKSPAPLTPPSPISKASDAEKQIIAEVVNPTEVQVASEVAPVTISLRELRGSDSTRRRMGLREPDEEPGLDLGLIPRQAVPASEVFPDPLEDDWLALDSPSAPLPRGLPPQFDDDLMLFDDLPPAPRPRSYTPIELELDVLEPVDSPQAAANKIQLWLRWNLSGVISQGEWGKWTQKLDDAATALLSWGESSGNATVLNRQRAEQVLQILDSTVSQVKIAVGGPAQVGTADVVLPVVLRAIDDLINGKDIRAADYRLRISRR